MKKVIGPESYVDDGFIQIPKALFKNPAYSTLKAEAKMLYGLMKDRSSLSKANGGHWIDENGTPFIHFSNQEIMDCLGCGEDKASRLAKDLQRAGLIVRTPQGLGKPYKVVVKNAVSSPKNTGSQHTNKKDTHPDFYGGNNTEKTYTNSSNTDSLLRRDAVRCVIKENICYDLLAETIPQCRLDLFVSIITDTICSKRTSVRIAGEMRHISEIRNRFFRLNDLHICYVHDRIERESSIIHSAHGYILMHLYRAEEEMDIYYGSCVNHDCNQKAPRYNYE